MDNWLQILPNPLRRLRVHGLIQRLPRSSRYQVTDTGPATAMFLNAIHERLLPTGLAAAVAYRTAIDVLTRTTGLTA